MANERGPFGWNHYAHEAQLFDAIKSCCRSGQAGRQQQQSGSIAVGELARGVFAPMPPDQLYQRNLFEQFVLPAAAAMAAAATSAAMRANAELAASRGRGEKKGPPGSLGKSDPEAGAGRAEGLRRRRRRRRHRCRRRRCSREQEEGAGVSEGNKLTEGAELTAQPERPDGANEDGPLTVTPSEPAAADQSAG